VPAQQPFWEQLMFGREHGPRAEREEKVLRYIVHRLDEEDAHLSDVLQETYVRRNCTQEMVDEIVRNPELIHSCREHLERVFDSGELDPRTRPQVSH
jgi:hypothetical protein